MKSTLLVLAAGMGSRYGGLKQIDGLGPNGETIIDYSIYDAIAAGFDKVVFVIRRDIEADFKAVFGTRYSNKIEVEYAFQTRTIQIDGKEFFREKPWGTAHAVLAAKDVIQEPFAVINADDFYGRDSFEKMHEFLTKKADDDAYSMVGYVLANTLSENGSVSRGICVSNSNNLLSTVIERTKIERIDGSVMFEEKGKKFEVDEVSLVSMNFWGFHPSIMNHIEKGFQQFVKQNWDEPKAEYYIPLIVNDLIQKRISSVEVLPTNAQWHGVTYKKDKPTVQKAINALYENDLYPKSLWA